MKEQPTPGPWFKEHTHPNPETAKSLAYINASGRTTPLEIASVYGCEEAEQNANAILIAAAPDLLEALELADEGLEHWEYGDDPRGAHGYRERVKAIIAKAKGET